MNPKTETDSQPIKVIFRKWHNGDVIALFPEVPHDLYGVYSMSYERIGQHGGADAEGLIGRTTPATPEEYASLKRELEGAPFGYVLRVVSRIPRNAMETRRAEIAAQDARATARNTQPAIL